MAEEPKNEPDPAADPGDGGAPAGGTFGWALLAIVLVGAAVLIYASGFHIRDANRTAGGGTSAPAAATSAIGGPFQLTNHLGQAVTEKDFMGKHMLVFFGYTFCPDVCPTTLTDVSSALDILGDAADKITPVFISVDPARDTPEHLKEYATYFHPRLVALTGTDAQIAAVAKAYRVYYAKAKQDPGADADDYLMDHSSVIYLMGPDGRFRVHFSHGTDPKTMAKRIRDNLS
ncbi:MAG: SCO family protein [Magnetovibrio sp.]|nr:SCO family protein [Magnetovibrio sp.]